MSFLRPWQLRQMASGRLVPIQFTLLFLVFSLVGAASAHASTVISVGAPSGLIRVGDIFTLEVLVGETVPDASDDVTDLFAYQFGVRYDPSVLSAVVVHEGAFLAGAGPTFFVSGSIDNSLGYIGFNANTLQGEAVGATGSGVLLSMGFRAIGAGETAVSAVFAANDGDGFVDSLQGSIAPLDTRDRLVRVEAVPLPGAIVPLGLSLGVLAMRRRSLHSATADVAC